MNSKKEDIDKFLETYIPSPSTGDMEEDSARVLRRLKSERRNARSGDSVMKESRAWWQPVAAAVLIGMVGIGLYAFRVQQVSPTPVVPPTTQSPAPSVKASAEITQVAGMTPEATKPGTAPSREEILVGVAAQVAAAQNTDAGAARPKFAEASVRPVSVSPVNRGFWCLGVDGLWGLGTAGRVSPPQGRCIGDVVNLAELLFVAFDAGAPPTIEEAGIPRNLASLNLQINAVADNPERVTKGELRLMVRTLLEDRFKVRVHLETRELDGYLLTIANSGIKFKEASGEEQCSGFRGSFAKWQARCRMETLTMPLTLLLGYAPVLDKTGLTGLYDINLSLNEIPMGGPAGTRGAGGGLPPPRQFSPPLQTALEEQLGLHLERAKIPIEFIVVDHIEMPTEN